MTITPDTKDWTWVLERPCAECGFAVRPTDTGRRGLRGGGAAFTVDSLGRYLAHECAHHLHDVQG